MKYNRIKINTLLLLLLIMISGLFAKIKNLQFERISSEDGLSQSSVLCIYQDSKGFMWFGTYDGLNRYDGYEFKVFKTNPADPKTISSNSIDYIYEDFSGNLWIGTGKGLNMFDAEKEQFIKYINDPNDPHSLSHNYVRFIYEDKKGTLWLGTHGGGLNSFNRETLRFKSYKNDPHNPHSIGHNNVLSILEDSDSNLWVGTDGGLCLFNPETEDFTVYKTDPNDPNSISADGVWRLFEDSDGYLWIGTWGNGLNRFSKENNNFIRYTVNNYNKYSISHHVIRSIAEDQEGNIWLGTDGGGLNILTAKEKHKRNAPFLIYKNDVSDPSSISSNQVFSLFQDNSGIMWAGCNFGGISKFNPGQQKFTHFKKKLNERNSLNNNSISSVYEDKNGLIWLGTTGGGINCFVRDKNSYEHFINILNDKKSLSNDVVRSIEEDKFGNIWVGTDNGLNKFDAVKKTFKSYMPVNNDSNSISYNTIWKLFRDRDGYLWVGTMDGLNKYDYKSDNFIRFMHDENDTKSISGNYIWSITEDSAGNLWIGTNAHGVNRLNPATNTFTHFVNDPYDPSSLSGNKVITLRTDKLGDVWIGTTAGLNKYNPETNGFIRFSEEKGITSNAIQSILEDDHGNLWIGTIKGLSKFDPKTETFKNFFKSDGLQSNEFAVDACYKLQNGEMVFGGTNGFNIFHPDSIKDNIKVPTLVLTNFTIFNKAIPVGEMGDGRTILYKSITESDEITLSYTDNVFSLEFSALHYASPKENLYAYMLEGFDNDWIYTNSYRRYASYTNLGGGKYIFRVKGSNNDEIWNDQGTTLKITIIPPLWETAWFRTIALIFIALCVYGIFKIRIRKIEQHRRELEQKVEERTHQLSAKAKALLLAKKETDNILNNVKEGFFVLNANFEISSQYSSALDSIFQSANLAHVNLMSFLKNKIADTEIENTRMYLELLKDVTIDEEAIRDLNPLVEISFDFNKKISSKKSKEKKYLDFFFKRISSDDKNTEIFVTVRDITKQVLLGQKLKDEEQRREKLLHLMLSILDVEPHMLADFRESTKRELTFINKRMNYDKITDYNELLRETHRSMHLIKGNAKLLRVDYFADLAHKFEDMIEEVQRKNNITNEDMDPLREKLFDMHNGLEEIEKIIEKMGHMLNHSKNDEKKSGSKMMLQSIENLIAGFSKDLGKKIRFSYKNFKDSFIPARYQLLVKEVLIQLVRNSISHGIEHPHERKKLKKPVTGNIELSTFARKGTIGFRLRDDGRGIQLGKLKEKAIASGKCNASEIEGWSDKQIADLIFSAGISTSDTVDMVSGRGVGMESVIHRLKEYQGEIHVNFSENQFCEFEILLPIHQN